MRVKIIRYLTVTLIVFMFMCSSAAYGVVQDVKVKVEVEQTFVNGYISWTYGWVRARGAAVPPTNVTSAAQGKLLARRGALMDAQRALLEIINGVQVDARSTMVNFMANDVVRTQVTGYLRGAQIVPASEKWDGEIYEIELEVSLYGLYRFVYPEALITPPIEVTISSPYTGLVIDARGLGITPSLIFRIFDVNGIEIYGAATAYYEVAVNQGFAGYTISLEHAIQDPRVGANPLVVTAVGARGDYRVDLVVSTYDGQQITVIVRDTDIFPRCAVIVVTD